MKMLTVREAREGLSHLEALFADNDEVVVTRHGEPVARLLPIKPRPKARSMAAFRATQPMQTVPSEVIIAQDRAERC